MSSGLQFQDDGEPGCGCGRGGHRRQSPHPGHRGPGLPGPEMESGGLRVKVCVGVSQTNCSITECVDLVPVETFFKNVKKSHILYIHRPLFSFCKQ